MKRDVKIMCIFLAKNVLQKMKCLFLSLDIFGCLGKTGGICLLCLHHILYVGHESICYLYLRLWPCGIPVGGRLLLCVTFYYNCTIQYCAIAWSYSFHECYIRIYEIWRNTPEMLCSWLNLGYDWIKKKCLAPTVPMEKKNQFWKWCIVIVSLKG